MIVAVTGHRPDKLGGEWDLKGPYSEFVAAKLGEHLAHFKPYRAISGMALGVDTIFAVQCIKMGVPLIAAVPFKGQEEVWRARDQDTYNWILKHQRVETVIVSDGGYAPWKLHIRNQWMVDNADVILAVWDGSPGGTANCIKYARQKKPVFITDLKQVAGSGLEPPISRL